MPEIPSDHWLLNPNASEQSEADALTKEAAGRADPAPDPILTLNAERSAAVERWSLADEAAEMIEYGLPEELRRPRVRVATWRCCIPGQESVKPAYAYSEDEILQYPWVKDETWRGYMIAELRAADAARQKALEENGYHAAKAAADQLSEAIDAIDLKMAETVPTTLPGVLALARAAHNLDASDCAQQMLACIVEGLAAIPTPAAKAVLALAEHATRYAKRPYTGLFLTMARHLREGQSTSGEEAWRLINEMLDEETSLKMFEVIMLALEGATGQERLAAPEEGAQA
jgi:hypothetical protein